MFIRSVAVLVDQIWIYRLEGSINQSLTLCRQPLLTTMTQEDRVINKIACVFMWTNAQVQLIATKAS
jgi:hypothetical protein